jgi:hypothetical protein
MGEVVLCTYCLKRKWKLLEGFGQGDLIPGLKFSC